MAISTRVWINISIALAGLMLGFGAATYRQEVVPRTRIRYNIREERNIEYENTYINAVVFRNHLRKEPTLDSLFKRTPFLSQAIRILRQDSLGTEALAVPRQGADENYYLIRGDSITLLEVSPQKAR